MLWRCSATSASAVCCRLTHSQLSLSSAFSADLRTGGIYKSRPKIGTGQKDNDHICVRTRKDLCSKEIDTNHFWHLEAWTGVEIRFASFRSLGWSERSESPIFFKFFFSPKFSVKIVMLTYHAWRHCSSSGLFWGILKYGSSVFLVKFGQGLTKINCTWLESWWTFYPASQEIQKSLFTTGHSRSIGRDWVGLGLPRSGRWFPLRNQAG